MKKSILSLLVFVAMATPVFASGATVVYNSPLLVLFFVGFCALLVVAQLVPAVLMLIGMTKAAAKSKPKYARSTLEK